MSASAKLINPVTDSIMQYGYCTDCDVKMRASAHQYECTECGLLLPIYGEKRDIDQNASSAGVIRVVGKDSRCSTYNISSDYSRAQRKVIMEQLNANNLAFEGPKIPKDVISKTADIYNSIQKLMVVGTTVMATAPEGVKATKFVKRGNIKDETLGALIFYLCIKVGTPRHKKDIAAFMQLNGGGISRGEFLVRKLSTAGLIHELPIGKDPTALYIDRYLETLGLDEHPQYDTIRSFIRALILRSIQESIGVSSMSSSKVAGAIWIVVRRLGLRYTEEQIENACDGIRRNTFRKFSDEVLGIPNILKFAGIFEAHGISHGYEGLIRRKEPPAAPTGAV